MKLNDVSYKVWYSVRGSVLDSAWSSIQFTYQLSQRMSNEIE
jgi:hypothetical protein